ncbi:hypothetical protein BH23GEM6_BH23GEM6_12060 [soil metagenome]
MSRKASGAKGKLKEYRAKRNFDRTREPSGETGKAAGRVDQRLQFAIQKHAASHLHYDLRLEFNGVMRSWAVPKGPSLNPQVKRLAMEVEDHPIEYNTFEGTIPQGEYGGGTVLLWDRGSYHPDEVRSGESSEAAVRRGLREGKLSFTMEGERLRGSFALVRTDQGPRARWLLLKHLDEYAQESGLEITEQTTTSVDTGRTMEEISRDADRVWRSNGPPSASPSAASSLNAPMVPLSADRLPPDRGWSFEGWRGGLAVLAFVTPDQVRMIDEVGQDVTTAHAAVAAELATLSRRAQRPFVLEGELSKGKEEPSFHATDLLVDGDVVLRRRSWKVRREALQKLFHRRRLSLIALQQVEPRGATMMWRAKRQGWAGVIARRNGGSYNPGERTQDVRRVSIC